MRRRRKSVTDREELRHFFFGGIYLTFYFPSKKRDNKHKIRRSHPKWKQQETIPLPLQPQGMLIKKKQHTFVFLKYTQI
jgi:hypothetical protein